MHTCCHILNLAPHSLHQMESAICLRYCPFPYGYSKGFQGARPSRFHLHATPLCAPQFSTTRRSPVTPLFRHANCMLERFSAPSENEGSGNKILRGVTGASVVLACVLGLFSFSGKMNPKFTTAYACSPPFDISTIEERNKGRVALESLLKIKTDAEKCSSNWKQISSKFTEKKEPDKNAIDALKLFAIAQSKTSEGRTALELLKKQYDLSKKKKWQDAKINLGVALIEVFMLQENFEEARKRLDEQIDKLLSENEKGEKLNSEQKSEELLNLYESDPSHNEKLWIAQLILYKAIVHTMLVSRGLKGTEAVEWRKAFSTID